MSRLCTRTPPTPRAISVPLTARNFNPLAAMSGRVTVAEVEHIVEAGGLDPDQIITPGVFVQRVVQARDRVKGH